ncbi:MAG: hypothetical protein WBM36_04900, partial [Lysobacterales bacterium]
GYKAPPGESQLLKYTGHFCWNLAAIQSSNQKLGLKISPDTCVPEWYGDHMDPGVAVDMLLLNE